MDSKTARLKAKNKLQFWTFIFFLILIIGARFEYFSLTKPLDEITVVFMAQKSEPVDVQPTTPAEQPATSADQPTASAEPANVQVEEPKNEPEPAVADTNSQAAQELLDYMDEIKQKVNDVSFTEPVLEKIEQSQSQNPSVENQPVFEENKIEIYDEEKGVVDVIETVSETVAEPSDKDEIKSSVSEEDALEESKRALSEVEAVAQQILENQEAKEEIENVIQQEQEAAEKSIQAVQERIDAEISVDDGEEKPIVLIPGLQQPQE